MNIINNYIPVTSSEGTTYKEGFRVTIGESSLKISNAHMQYITICYDSLEMILQDNKQLQKDIKTKSLLVDGIFGIYSSINDTYYLIVITKSTVICKINEQQVRKVNEIQFIPLFTTKTEQNEEIQSIIDNINEILLTGFYFSNGYDISNNFSTISQHTHNNYDHIYNSNYNFIANLKFTEMFLVNGFGHKFISSCIYGYVGLVKHKLLSNSGETVDIEVILISRRYVRNYGIEQYKQGITKNGFLSNHIEHEMLLTINNNVCYSYLLLSGDIPCYQRELSPEKENKELIAYNDYIKQLHDEYWIVCYIGGYLKEDIRDKTLRRKFRKILRNDNDNKFIKYFEYFTKEETYDVDSNSSSNELTDENEVEAFIENRIQAVMDVFEFTSKNDLFDNVNIDQRGIISINTKHPFILLSFHNAILYYVIEKMLFLSTIPLPKDNTNIQIFITQLKTLLIKCHNDLNLQYYSKYQNSTAENYQRTLEILVGIPPKIKPLHVTLNPFKHLFSSNIKLTVYIATWNVNNLILDDELTQRIPFDKWLLPQNESCIPDVYCISLQEAIGLSAYNVVKGNFKEIHDKILQWETIITKVITRERRVEYEKVKVLQLVGLVLFVFIKKDKMKYVKGFKFKKIKMGLGGATGNKGSCLVSMDILNTSIGIAGMHLSAGDQKKEHRINELKQVMDTTFNNVEEIKLDNNNNNNNRVGHSIWDENVDDINKDNNDTNTNASVNTISDNTTTTNNNNNDNSNNAKHKRTTTFKRFHTETLLHKRKPMIIKSNDELLLPPLSILKFKHHDIWFMFGDLNFRTETDIQNISQLIETNNITSLIEYDQLNKLKMVLNDLKEINEAKITFLPTYKFMKGTNDYFYKDAKQTLFRKPSYCDRILFKHNNNIVPIEYASLQKGFEYSDHRPVYGIYEVNIMEEIQNLKNQLEDKIKLHFDLNISSQYLLNKYK